MVVPVFSRRMLSGVEQTVWDVYGQSGDMALAAGAVGMERTTVRKWIVEAGGVRSRRGRGSSGRGLSFDERVEIQVGVSCGRSFRAIAARLGRSASTVSREVGLHRDAGGDYVATKAHAQAWTDAARPQPRKLATNEVLCDRVRQDLQAGWSPQQIAGRLRREFGDDPEMTVHHDTIYRELYLQARGSLKVQVKQALRTGRTRRKPRRSRPPGNRGRIPNMISIADRPAIDDIDGTRIPGHWEGDLIVGKGCGSAVGTVVERATGYLLLLHLPNGHTAPQVAEQLASRLTDLPESLRKSLTWDQGREMANHTTVSVDADIDIYFCDPHSPWQRPSNENINGLLRQYLPKGTNLNAHSAEDLARIEALMNDRPRQRLDYAKPHELMTELLLR